MTQQYLLGLEHERRKPELSQFYTPADTAKRIAQFAIEPFTARQRAKLSVLEPSAGDGALVRAMLQHTPSVCAVEIDPDRRERLVAMLGEHRVRTGSFLDLDPQKLPRFDAVVMNPPFEDGQYEAHVLHALHFAPVVIAHIPLASLESSTRAQAFWPHMRIERGAVCASRANYGTEASRSYGGKTAMATFHLESCVQKRDVRVPQKLTLEIWTS